MHTHTHTQPVALFDQFVKKYDSKGDLGLTRDGFVQLFADMDDASLHSGLQ